MIRLDCTKFSTVVKCTLCPWWAAFAEDRVDGLRVGARHEAAAHPSQPQRARNALDQRKSRESRK